MNQCLTNRRDQHFLFVGRLLVGILSLEVVFWNRCCELAFGISRLGTSMLLANVSLGYFARVPSFGIYRLGIVMKYKHGCVQQKRLPNRT